MTTKTKWTEEKVLEVVRECREAGPVAAAAKLAELTKAGPRYGVMSGSVQIDTMLDVCGFANVKLKSARGNFFKLAKRLSSDRSQNYRFSCSNHYYGGGHFNVFDCSRRQEMSVNTAAMKAVESERFTQAAANIGFSKAYLGADDFGKVIASDDAFYGDILNQLGMAK